MAQLDKASGGKTLWRQAAAAWFLAYLKRPNFPWHNLGLR
jgi:hypothetical protein